MSHRVVVSDTKVVDIERMQAQLDEIGATVETTNATEPTAVLDAAAGADALVVDAGTQVTEQVIASLETLQDVGRTGIGVDNVDVRAAAEHGVRVVNVPGYCLDEVSAHALGLLLACARRIPTFDRSVRDDQWDWTAGGDVRRIRGSTIGLVAFGKIARSLAAKLRGFGVDVLTYDPYLSEPELSGFDVEKVSFEALLARSDFVSIHAPLTAETRGLFDGDAFEAMQDHAVLVNTARGGIVDEEALYEALTSGEVDAAALDVRETEPPLDSRLGELENVVLSPHVGWYSEASRRELCETVCSDVIRVLQGECPENPVDPDDEW
jgi:D-3-phosphoglycerate dehydrogenase